MKYSVDMLFKARQEIFDAWKWYEDEVPGLGDRFENEVYRKIDLIEANPLHYPLKGRMREAVTEVFPFLIIYRVNTQSKLITIVSIFHTSRHPKRKYRMQKKRG